MARKANQRNNINRKLEQTSNKIDWGFVQQCLNEYTKGRNLRRITESNFMSYVVSKARGSKVDKTLIRKVLTRAQESAGEKLSVILERERQEREEAMRRQRNYWSL